MLQPDEVAVRILDPRHFRPRGGAHEPRRRIPVAGQPLVTPVRPGRDQRQGPDPNRARLLGKARHFLRRRQDFEHARANLEAGAAHAVGVRIGPRRFQPHHVAIEICLFGGVIGRQIFTRLMSGAVIFAAATLNIDSRRYCPVCFAVPALDAGLAAGFGFGVQKPGSPAAVSFET